jgi:hypothetical protein
MRGDCRLGFLPVFRKETLDRRLGSSWSLDQVVP